MLTFTDESHRKAKSVVFTCAVLICLAALVFAGIYFSGVMKRPQPAAFANATSGRSASKLGRYRTAAVCADAGICATVGRSMLERGGNAVDAALAALLCDGVANPHSMGIGGGFVMTLYNHSTGQAQSLIAREAAPAAAAEDMYATKEQAQRGALSVAVPGEIPGYWAVHQRYGRLPWRLLFQPAINMCRFGIPVSHEVAEALQGDTVRALLNNHDFGLGDIFLKGVNKTLEVGDVFRRTELANTLEKIAEGGLQAYQDLGAKLAEDIQAIGGILTHEDIASYMPEWTAPVRVPLPSRGLTLYSVPPPASGAVIAAILGVLDGLGLTPERMSSDQQQAQTLHTMAEVFKFAYAQRSRLGDPRFADVDEVVRNMTSEAYMADVRRRVRPEGVLGAPEQYGAMFHSANESGTAHISVVDGQGSAVSVTSTINLRFGSCVRSRQTGIILNDEMDDFSSNFTNYFGFPPSEANFIAPRKRPQSSMAPTILVDAEGTVLQAIGASGGSKITSVTAYVSARNLWLGDNIKQAVDAKRIHHQLLPDQLMVEEGISEAVLEQLRGYGHHVKSTTYLARVCGISRDPGGLLEANADYRKGGDVAGY